uniref:non-canonical purine NTP pyrophosphatase n=1 Tax=Blastococcus sp. Marseille-P5729 TaxID=2086582 RepID=UPI00351A4BFF
TFEDNALLKAREAVRATGLPAIAADPGIRVAAPDLAWGVPCGHAAEPQRALPVIPATASADPAAAGARPRRAPGHDPQGRGGGPRGGGPPRR